MFHSTCISCFALVWVPSNEIGPSNARTPTLPATINWLEERKSYDFDLILTLFRVYFIKSNHFSTWINLQRNEFNVRTQFNWIKVKFGATFVQKKAGRLGTVRKRHEKLKEFIAVFDFNWFCACSFFFRSFHHNFIVKIRKNWERTDLALLFVENRFSLFDVFLCPKSFCLTTLRAITTQL